MTEGNEAARYPLAYIRYLVEFHATRDYFECHELLEEHWKSVPGDRYAAAWVGLIQLAVGCYHHRRGNLPGAVKMFTQAKQRLTAETLNELGLCGAESMAMLKECLAAAHAGGAFRDIELPLSDDSLLRQCQRIVREEGLTWGAPSPRNESLTERHRLRDRSDVVAAREAAMKSKGQR